MVLGISLSLLQLEMVEDPKQSHYLIQCIPYKGIAFDQQRLAYNVGFIFACRTVQ